MAIKKKAAVKKEVKTRDFHAIGDNKNDLKMVVYGEGSEAGDYISYFALLIINGLQVSGTLKLSTNEEKAYKEYIQPIIDRGISEDDVLVWLEVVGIVMFLEDAKMEKFVETVKKNFTIY